MFMKSLLLMVLGCLSLPVYAGDLSAQQKNAVQSIINHFKNNDRQAIIQAVHYPLTRETPLPSIKNAQQMQKRYAEVFDNQLSQKIARSKVSDWGEIGWRGIAFEDGKVWLNQMSDDEHAPWQIITVNYESAAEKSLRQKALQQQKAQLHPSLQNFKEPVFLFQTPKHLVRIDLLNNDAYRYASWRQNSSQSSKPDLVLTSKDSSIEGSAGNQNIVFKSGPYTYEVYRNIVGASSADMLLTVLKNGQPILNEEGTLIDY